MSQFGAHRLRAASDAPSLDTVTNLPRIHIFRRSPLNRARVLIPAGGEGTRLGDDIVAVPVKLDGQQSDERMKPLVRITRHRTSLGTLSALSALGRELWAAGVDPAQVHLVAGRRKVAAFGAHTNEVIEALRHHASRDEIMPTAIALAEAFGLHIALGERGVVEPHTPHLPGGIGKAVRAAMEALDNLVHHPAPSLVVLPDDLVTDKAGQARDWSNLIRSAQNSDSSVLTRVIPAAEAAGKYGVVWCDSRGKVIEAIEKPSIDEIKLMSARTGNDPNMVRVVTGWAVSGAMYPHFGEGSRGEVDITSGIIGKILAHRQDQTRPTVWAVDSATDVDARHDLGNSAGLQGLQKSTANNHHPDRVVAWMLGLEPGGGRVLGHMTAWAGELGIDLPVGFGERLRGLSSAFFQDGMASRDPHATMDDINSVNALAGLSRPIL